MEGTSMISQILEVLYSAFGETATAMGTAFSEMASAIFLTSAGSLSTFGTLILIFASISLALGLVRWVMQWITSLGARNQ